jgi:hypothetical protein
MNPLWSHTSSEELNELHVPARRPAEGQATAQQRSLLSCGRDRVRTPLVLWALVAFMSLLFATRGFAAGSQVVESRGLVNTTRSQMGLRALSPQAALDQIAQKHAQEMAARDGIFHYYDIGARADAAGVNWTEIGENVGVGPTVKDVHTAFMNSSGHRANIVHASFNVIGVGIAIGKDGSVFVAHEFATVSAAAPASAPATTTVSKPASSQAQVAGITRTPQPVKTPVRKAPVVRQPAPAKSAFPNALQGGRVTSLPL